MTGQKGGDGAVTKARPLDRNALLGQTVTDVDAFTALRYLRHRDTTPRILEIEEQGQTQLPGTEGALLDLYHSLWAPEPEVKGEDETPPARRYWRSLLDQALATAAYQELHATTQLKELFSVLGTIGMAETVLKLVPDEDQEQLQQLNEQQRSADAADAEAQQAEAEADALQALLGQLAGDQTGEGAGDGSPSQDGQPGSGSPSQAGQGDPSFTSDESASNAQATSQVSPGSSGGLTADQARQLANALAEAKANATAARELADEAVFQAELSAEALLGKPGSAEAAAKLDQLAKLGLAALKAAKDQVEEVSETLQAWGLEPAELTQAGLPEALGILEQLRRKPRFKGFAQLLGRLKRIAAKKATSAASGEGARVTRRETGRDLRRATTRELVALSSQATRPQALRRWVRGELELRGEDTKARLGHGPVVVCEDASGSMDGTKQQWAKGVTLALAHFAKLTRRSFGWVLFDARVQRKESYPQGRLSPRQIISICEARAGGGTDFEAPLRAAIELIEQTGLKQADILLITDGECAVSDQFLRELRAAQARLEFNVVTLLCDVGSSSDATAAAFSDRIEHVSAFTAEEAETKLFRHL